MKLVILTASILMSAWAQAATVNDAKVIGFNTIEVDVTYGGGCLEHTFKLKPNDLCSKSIPAQCQVELIDLTEGDHCRALVSTKVQFKLSDFGLDKGVYSSSVLRTTGDNESVATVTPVSSAQLYESLSVEAVPAAAERTELVFQKKVGGVTCTKTDHIRRGVSYSCSFN